jgi:glycosyltransferase involved in cell wall biosynthesis
LKHFYFAVTNDLIFDQRMHRICTSLSDAGYKVTLVGRKLKTSSSLEQKRFAQKRLRCFFSSGFLFYAEYNIKLFFFLVFRKMEGICAIDLDTVIPCLLVSKIRGVPAIYDAHEFFTEMKEVRERPLIKKIWTIIERYTLPRFKYCYTVSNGLATGFAKKYGKSYEVIRNVPYLKTLPVQMQVDGYLFYAGAVNEARGFECLIPAMKTIQYKLVICGDGNFVSKLKDLIRKHQVEDKIELKGMTKPGEIYEMAQKALLGFNLVERDGLNQYYSLANKFFDYIQAGLPQITMNFPEYALVNGEYEVAVLINDLSIETLSDTIQKTLNNTHLLEQLHRNTLKARQVYNWETEEKKLLQIYDKVCKESGLINGN